jgi:hypothetical protein
MLRSRYPFPRNPEDEKGSNRVIYYKEGFKFISLLVPPPDAMKSCVLQLKKQITRKRSGNHRARKEKGGRNPTAGRAPRKYVVLQWKISSCMYPYTARYVCVGLFFPRLCDWQVSQLTRSLDIGTRSVPVRALLTCSVISTTSLFTIRLFSFTIRFLLSGFFYPVFSIGFYFLKPYVVRYLPHWVRCR